MDISVSKETIDKVEKFVKEISDRDPIMSFWILSQVQSRILNYLTDGGTKIDIFEEARDMARQIDDISGGKRVIARMIASNYMTFTSIKSIGEQLK